MPLYDYICTKCGAKRVDVVVSNHAADIVCPRCPYSMTRLPPRAAFTVQGFNAKNGYGLKGDK